jgi:MoaA/NifB/PqqE/SkfB family radical SAM enzyme
MTWRIIYRSRLSTCNYRCGYCPLPKKPVTAGELRQDAAGLGNFVDWAAGCGHRLEILFAPNGEALIHNHYWHAVSQLSKAENVALVAVQTNLSAPMNFAVGINPERIAFWTTFHPGNAGLPSFLSQLSVLRELRIRHSVGMVGVKRHFPAIRRLRDCLPPETYLWINAYKSRPDYYSAADVDFLTGIDPHFPLNLHNHPSRGISCEAGESTFVVDDQGTVSQCLFTRITLGNIRDPAFPAFLHNRPCPIKQCKCHLGHICIPELNTAAIYGPASLSRIPLHWDIDGYRRASTIISPPSTAIDHHLDSP